MSKVIPIDTPVLSSLYIYKRCDISRIWVLSFNRRHYCFYSFYGARRGGRLSEPPTIMIDWTASSRALNQDIEAKLWWIKSFVNVVMRLNFISVKKIVHCRMFVIGTFVVKHDMAGRISASLSQRCVLIQAARKICHSLSWIIHSHWCKEHINR